jgi:hypothetical protein
MSALAEIVALKLDDLHQSSWSRYRRTLVLAAETERPARRLMDPDAIDHVVRKYAGGLRLDRC